MSGASWYSANRSTVKRSEGRNAVACAAYVAGAKLYDETERTTHDYTRKRGVVESFVTTPFGKDGLEWAHDIERLATAMESHEKRKDAQVAHQWRIALPDALDDEQREALTINAAQKLSDLYGVAVIGGIHRPDEKGDDRNHHAHLLFTTRTVEPEGKLGSKVTVITSPKTSDVEVTRYREIVADLINEALSDAGANPNEFVSHLSYAERGIEKVPTIHLGPAASGLERKGLGSDRGDINREILDAREAIEARLVWQQDVAQPEVDAAVELDLAQRFGDEFASLLKEAQAGAPLPSIEEHAARDAEPLHEDTATSGGTDMLAEPRGWRERVKAFAAHALELFHDERSGISQEPAVTPQPEPAAEPPAPETMRRSWVSRIKEAGLHLLHGWQHRDGKEVAEGISEAIGMARAIATPAPSPEPSPTEPPGEPSRPVAQVDAAEPDARPQEAAAKPMSAFERFAASVAASKLQPEDNPLSSLERYRASFNEGGGPQPKSRDPWSAFADAYQRALRGQPEPDGRDEPEPPEPKAPEPDYGPDIDF